MAGAEDKSRAHSLVEGLYTPLGQQCRPTIYDTALVAMLSRTKTDSAATELVYPESFQYLLDHQQVDGGWAMRDFRLGTILNTLAGLLAIVKRPRSLSGGLENAAALDLRATKATEFLREKLTAWDPKSEAHLDSIVLVPALLAMLRAENIHFQFQGSAQLENQRMERLRRAEPASPQGNGFDPRLFYLETYMDAVEFQRSEATESYHGISCSPSSTAAFLLGSNVWSEEYESYLSAAIKATGTRGGVPSLFPPSCIEAAYTIEVLLESGLLDTTASTDSVHRINKKCAGKPRFSSLQTTESLNISTQLLIYKLSAQANDTQHRDQLETQLLSITETSNTNFEERCRILKTLLRSPRVDESNIHISSLFKSMCASWWTGSRESTLSRSPLYEIMLFAECFVDIFGLSHHTSTTLASSEDIDTRAPVIIVQMLAMILSFQYSDGSWGPRGCSETTAYAILALIAIAKLPHVRVLNMEIRHAIERGRQALSMMRESWAKSHSLWIGKTAHGSDRLSEAFSLAAMHKPFKFYDSSEQTGLPTDKQSQKVLALAKFFHDLDNLAEEPIFKIKAAALESALYVSKLKSIRNDIFPPTAAKEKDKYLDYIPTMFTIHSIVRNIFTPPQFLWDFAVLSMFIFLVDEYMESKVGSFTSKEYSLFRQGIEEMFALDDSSQPDIELHGALLIEGPSGASAEDIYTDNTHAAKPRQRPNENVTDRTRETLLLIHPIDFSSVHSDQVRAALSVIAAWARYLMTYESVVSSSAIDLLDLRMEIRNYILYHVHQLEDNQRLSKQHQYSLHPRFSTPRMGYASWLHTVGGGHIGAPISLVFFACITGSRVRGEGKDCFSSVQQKLMIWNCNTHAAKQLRMYNDYGSVARDAEEGNLSSVNFPEFFGDGDEARGRSVGGFDATFRLMQTKQTLLELANYERRHTNQELDELCQELEAEGVEGKKVSDLLRIYFAGGDQFSDMYLVRDVTNATKQAL